VPPLVIEPEPVLAPPPIVLEFEPVPGDIVVEPVVWAPAPAEPPFIVPEPAVPEVPEPIVPDVPIFVPAPAPMLPPVVELDWASAAPAVPASSAAANSGRLIALIFMTFSARGMRPIAAVAVRTSGVQEPFRP
jgi:hypothetical protein